jgi:hypothetical protein
MYSQGAIMFQSFVKQRRRGPHYHHTGTNRKVDTIWKKTAALLVAATLLGTVVRSARSQPLPFNGHYYEYVESSLNWTDARAAAAAISYDGVFGHLATVTSQTENDFLFSFRPSPTGTFRGAWIGARVASGIQTWVVGPETTSALVYKNWGGIEPNNGGTGLTAYGYMHIGSGSFDGISPGKWADAPNGITTGNTTNGDPVVGYFVEFESVPEPRSLTLAAIVVVLVMTQVPRRHRRGFWAKNLRIRMVLSE